MKHKIGLYILWNWKEEGVDDVKVLIGFITGLCVQNSENGV